MSLRIMETIEMTKQQLFYYNEIKELATQRGWKLLSLSYKDGKTHMLFVCPKGHIREMQPCAFKKGNNCGACPSKPEIKAEEDFRKMAHDNGFIIDGEYTGNNNDIGMICPFKHKIHPTPGAFKEAIKNGTKSKGCKECNGKDHDKNVTNFMEFLFKHGYKCLGEYINARTYIRLQCPKGHIFEVTPDVFKSSVNDQIEKYGTVECAGHCHERTKDEFLSMLIVEDYKLVGEYINSTTRVEIECNENHITAVLPSQFKDGYRCNRCFGSNKENALIKLRERAIHFNHKIVGEYITYDTKIDFECDKGHPYRTIPRCIGQCSTCNESHLERETRLYLGELNISFVPEYTLPELPRKRYDFFFEYKGRNCLLEDDGRQHFDEGSYYNIVEGKTFEYKRNIDKLKTLVGFNLGYYVIRIDYTKIKNIREHIDKALEQINILPYYVSDPELYLFLLEPLSLEFIGRECPFLLVK